jgi:hypothetical protein
MEWHPPSPPLYLHGELGHGREILVSTLVSSSLVAIALTLEAVKCAHIYIYISGLLVAKEGFKAFKAKASSGVALPS